MEIAPYSWQAVQQGFLWLFISMAILWLFLRVDDDILDLNGRAYAGGSREKTRRRLYALMAWVMTGILFEHPLKLEPSGMPFVFAIFAVLLFLLVPAVDVILSGKRTRNRGYRIG